MSLARRARLVHQAEECRELAASRDHQVYLDRRVLMDNQDQLDHRAQPATVVKMANQVHLVTEVKLDQRDQQVNN